MRRTQLAISAGHLREFTDLSSDFGMYCRDSTLNLSVKSDGKGGLLVEATNDASERKKTVLKESSTDSNNSSEVDRIKEKKNRWPLICYGTGVILVCLITFYIVFKRRLNKH